MLQNSNKMKKIWLMGGFGNTLFQIMAYNILVKEGYEVGFKTTLTEKNIITSMLKWKIHEPIYLELIRQESIVKSTTVSDLLHLCSLYLSKTLRLNLKSVAFYDEKNRFSMEYSDNIYGYFQDKSFLAENKKELLELGTNLRNRYACNTDATVVHYRRGDSVWARKHERYYTDIKKLLRQEDGQILIVTDSIDEATEFFMDINNVNIIKSERAIDDFRHLLSAKKLFCAPSTFSWWAAHCLDDSCEVVIPTILIRKLGFYSSQLMLKIV
tara:strand:+ start:5594 stop:6400 length:807 start_codon:yes stop_codon:yes gene_type:complete